MQSKQLMQLRCGQNDPKKCSKISFRSSCASQELLNKNVKKLQELVDTVWEMETATEKLKRAKMTRVEILQQQLSVVCICQGEWLKCALEILENNSICFCGFVC